MPINFSQQDRQNLLSHLSNGRQNATGALRLAQLMGFPTGSNQVRLRSLIKECIESDGDLIGAATATPAGFFIIDDMNELNIYLDTMEGRVRSDNDRRNALINSWNATNPPTSRQNLTVT